jgi:hypothetical protein
MPFMKAFELLQTELRAFLILAPDGVSDSLHALDTIKVHKIHFCLLLYLRAS